MVSEFLEFETPDEPQIGTVNSIQAMYNSMMLDVSDDLQDEIGTRREQFDSLSKTCDDLRTRISRVDAEMATRTERDLKLAVIGITIGAIGICANIMTFLFL